jgi:hypothetical protein
MKKGSRSPKKDVSYHAPMAFVGLFYGLLSVWTGVCVILLGTKAVKVGWPLGQLLMIAFVLAYTWYFSVGISYKVKVKDDGEITFTSFRRLIQVNAKDIPMVEGPRLALLPYCFLRFRLEREKAYLFCRITDPDLQRTLTAMREVNREMKLKGL